VRAAWDMWCARNGGVPWSPKALYAALSERGFHEKKRQGDRGFAGLALRCWSSSGRGQMVAGADKAEGAGISI
jgi:hypothetical protein